MITNYSSLQTAIADWLARSDLTAQIPTFIRLAEARMNKDLRTVDMQSEATGAVTPSTKSIPVPSDCLQLQSVRVLVGGVYLEIHPLPPERMGEKDIDTTIPKGYIRVGAQLYLVGGTVPAYAPGETGKEVYYKILYFKKVPELSDTATTEEQPGGITVVTPANATNWLLQKEPGLYLYASLIEASPYIQDDARSLVWAKQYESILIAMRIEDERARYGNAPARMAPRGMP